MTPIEMAHSLGGYHRHSVKIDMAHQFCDPEDKWADLENACMILTNALEYGALAGPLHEYVERSRAYITKRMRGYLKIGEHNV
jgi:hypothetical protein